VSQVIIVTMMEILGRVFVDLVRVFVGLAIVFGGLGDLGVSIPSCHIVSFTKAASRMSLRSTASRLRRP
ncbi:MAG: hypothetical protein FWD80_07510, partial [Propionibacteriaceae bacterium]|nr:hypothetical protein [Propionibacteriaceae bacterium]